MYQGLWIRYPPFLKQAKELLLLFYVKLKPLLRILFSFTDHILILPSPYPSFYSRDFLAMNPQFFFISHTIKGPNRRTQRIFVIDANVIHWQFQPQNQHHHQHLILHCCHPSHWFHIWHLPPDLEARHICPVEVCGIAPPPVGPVSKPEPHAFLCSTGAWWVHRSAPHAVDHRLLQHASVQIVYFVDMRSKPSCSTTWVACDNL